MAASGETPKERRENLRDDERIEILGELHGGAQVETSFPLQLDSLHELRLTLGDRSVILKARVAHCSICDVDQELVTYRSGVEFVEPSERVFAVISGFIDAIKDGRRAL
jgi:hypothetical protein